MKEKICLHSVEILKANTFTTKTTLKLPLVLPIGQREHWPPRGFKGQVKISGQDVV